MNKGVFSYALLAMPLSFIGIPLYIYLPEFYASNFGVSLTNIGFAILLTRMLDTITDPLLGYVSDAFPHFRKGIICVSALMLGVSFYFLFNPLFESKMLNLIVFSIITYGVFSLVTINHLALISNFENTVRTSSLRESFTVLGLLLATIMPSMLMMKYSSLQTFEIVGVFVCLLLVFCGLMFLKNIHVKAIDVQSKFRWGCINNATIQKYFAVLLFNAMAIAAPSTLVIFYIKNFLQLEMYTGVFLATYFISAIVFIPLWKILCQRIGEIKLFKIGMACSIGVFSLCYFVGIDLILPTLITNNIIEKHGIENARTFIFGITHFISKIAIALISGIVLITLGSKAGVEYNEYLRWFYTILPCILKILSLYVLYSVKI
jgi:glycoside/pentoside/hexuronide:cation symporter, GPH family